MPLVVVRADITRDTHSQVDICRSIDHLIPREYLVKDLADRLVLLLFEHSIRNAFRVPTSGPRQHISEYAHAKRAHRTGYLGSQWTYPLLSPFTSFTTSSKLLKSIAVTASNATSRRTRDHSKKA